MIQGDPAVCEFDDRLFLSSLQSMAVASLESQGHTQRVALNQGRLGAAAT